MVDSEQVGRTWSTSAQIWSEAADSGDLGPISAESTRSWLNSAELGRLRLPAARFRHLRPHLAGIPSLGVFGWVWPDSAKDRPLPSENSRGPLSRALTDKRSVGGGRWPSGLLPDRCRVRPIPFCAWRTAESRDHLPRSLPPPPLGHHRAVAPSPYPAVLLDFGRTCSGAASPMPRGTRDALNGAPSPSAACSSSRMGPCRPGPRWSGRRARAPRLGRWPGWSSRGSPPG